MSWPRLDWVYARNDQVWLDLERAQHDQRDAIGRAAAGSIGQRAVVQSYLRQSQRFVHRLAVPGRRPVVLWRDDKRFAHSIQRALERQQPRASTPSSFVTRILILSPFQIANACSCLW